MKKTRQLIYFAIIWFLYSSLLRRYTMLEELRVLIVVVPDIIVFYLFFNKRKKIKAWNRKHLFGTSLYVLYLLVFALGTFNGFLNNNNPMNVLWGVRLTFRFALLFILIVNFCKDSDVDRIKRLIYKSYYVCVVFCFLQFLSGEFGDSVGGIFGGNKILCIFTILVAIIAGCDYFQKNIDAKRLIMIISGMFIIAIVAEIKFLYYAIPVCFSLCFVFVKKFSVFSTVIFAAVIYLSFPITQIVMSLYYDDSYIENTFDQDYIDEETTHTYGFMKGGFNRSTAIELTTSVIIPKMPQLLTGYGIGSGSASQFFSGEIFNKYKYTTYHFFATSYILVELGWIGFVALAICVALLAFRFYKFNTKYSRNPKVKYWSTCGLVSALMTYILSWYTACPYDDFYLFYMLWGISFVAIKHELWGNRNIVTTGKEQQS